MVCTEEIACDVYTVILDDKSSLDSSTSVIHKSSAAIYRLILTCLMGLADVQVTMCRIAGQSSSATQKCGTIHSGLGRLSVIYLLHIANTDAVYAANVWFPVSVCHIGIQETQLSRNGRAMRSSDSATLT